LEVIFLAIGVVIGILLGFFIGISKYKHISSKLEERNTALQERLDEQKNETLQLQEKFAIEFENLANKILEEKSRRFTEQNKENLDTLLNPLKEKIDEFKGKVEKVYKDESDERNILKGEINKLMELNRQISEEAENLTKALKGDVRTQGNWGELVLQKILERSGLVKDREYKIHYNAIDTEGRRIQPDVVVFLPDDKHIVIDSKVSLLAYQKYVNSEGTVERNSFLKEHLASLKAHIKNLSEKNYHANSKFNSPDFVLLFMPIESSFSLVVDADVELFDYAWERKIQIVTPSTLLISLMTIVSLWQREKQSTFAVEIADIAGNLYDKFESMIKDLIDVGKKINQMHESYTDVMRKLHSGRGNLVSQVEKMKKLGATTKKSLPKELLDRAKEENGDDKDDDGELKLFLPNQS
jgi:DNA recombination protein RmuC